ncbi:serine protease [Gigaspora margarita]|uniref:Serine protease n=1 Tax=Gigaspora margarita TaxID=4874 RepID=A0A8H4AQ04_GIGMA|nr:serine protease [Gigaspora margarita]
MNKKFSLYLLIVLIAIMVITSHASVISQRNAFRTPEKIKETARFKAKHERNLENEKRSKHKIYSRNIVVEPILSQMNPNLNFPIGRFLINLGNGSVLQCTASVINTTNGNIGLTSAHCLTKDDGTTFDLKDLSFSPGYDNQQEGPLGTINIENLAVPYTHLVDPDVKDYALVKFAFTDPNKGNARLQDYTGALGWRFDIGNNTLTNVFGYPASGDMVNCTKDGKHLCVWQGNVQKDNNYYFIDDVNLGSGASGSPLIFQYNRNEHLGYVYAAHEAYVDETDESIAPIWDEQIFLGLLLKLS